jgi:hypothetical protein
MSAAPAIQTREDREQILNTLPTDTRRVQVRGSDSKTVYKRPGDIDLDVDEVLLSNSGKPIVMRGKPGRKVTRLTPVSNNVEEVMEARADHLQEDHLLSATLTASESEEVMDTLLASLAQEAASIAFEKAEAERHGHDTSHLAVKRARVLKMTADTWLKRRDKNLGGTIDLDSPAFEALFAFILETIREAMGEAGLRQEHVETVFAKVSKRLADTWKEEAKARMREKA